MAGLVPAIHDFSVPEKAWMPATSAGMTAYELVYDVAGLVTATPSIMAQRQDNRGGRDKPNGR